MNHKMWLAHSHFTFSQSQKPPLELLSDSCRSDSGISKLSCTNPPLTFTAMLAPTKWFPACGRKPASCGFPGFLHTEGLGDKLGSVWFTSSTVQGLPGGEDLEADILVVFDGVSKCTQ